MDKLVTDWKINALGTLNYANTQKAFIFYVTGEKSKAFDLFSPNSKYYELLYNFTYNSAVEGQKNYEEDLKNRRQRG